MSPITRKALDIYNSIMYPDREENGVRECLDAPVIITRREYKALRDFRKTVLYGQEEEKTGL